MFTKNHEASPRTLLEGIELKTLTWGEKMLLGQFTLAQNSKVPTHSHPYEQIGYLVAGKLRFVVADQIVDAEAGDSWCIPADVAHSAEALETSVAIEVFAPVREDYLP